MSCTERFKFIFQRLRHVIVSLLCGIIMGKKNSRRSRSEIKFIMQIQSIITLKKESQAKIIKGEKRDREKSDLIGRK